MEQMRIIYAILSKISIVSQQTNMNSLVEIIESLTVESPNSTDSRPAFAKIEGHFTVLLQHEGLEEQVLTASLGVVVPTGERVELGSDFSVTLQKKRQRLTFALENFPYSGPGQYEVKVEVSVQDRGVRAEASYPIIVQEQAAGANEIAENV